MQLTGAPSRRKYLYAELCFFVVFFLLFPVLTDVEYNLREKPHTGRFTDDIIYRIFYGIFEMLAFWPFYKIIQRYLFTGQVWRFMVGAVLFLAVYNYYTLGLYYVVGHSGIFTGEMQKNALQYAHSSITFSIIFMLHQFICVTALAYFIRSDQQDTQMRDLKEQHFIAELNYLKAQLQPHFFFNTLNNIYALALRQSADTAPLVARLSVMMRYILYETNQPKTALSKEISFLTNYVEVEKVRHTGQITIEFDAQGIDTAQQIEPLLLLPFIENAFKHGIEHETGSGFVHIIICMAEQELTLQVANSKPAAAPGKQKGLGLQNVAKRLELLYPDRYALDVQDEADRYQLNLTLQMV